MKELTKIESGLYEVRIGNELFEVEKIESMMNGTYWVLSQNGVRGKKQFSTKKEAAEYLFSELNRVYGA